MSKQAQLEYLKGDFTEAFRILSSSSYLSDGGDDVSGSNKSQGESRIPLPSGTVGVKQSPQYFNNIACLYLSTRKFGASTLFFQKSLAAQQEQTGREIDAAVAQEMAAADAPHAVYDGRGGSATTYQSALPHPLSIDILYNKGLSLLASGSSPLEAYVCFEATKTQLGQRPHLWIRIAECCIQFNHLKRDKDACGARCGVGGLLQSTSIAKGRSRRIVLRFGSCCCCCCCLIFSFYTVKTYL